MEELLIKQSAASSYTVHPEQRPECAKSEISPPFQNSHAAFGAFNAREYS